MADVPHLSADFRPARRVSPAAPPASTDSPPVSGRARPESRRPRRRIRRELPEPCTARRYPALPGRPSARPCQRLAQGCRTSGNAQAGPRLSLDAPLSSRRRTGSMDRSPAPDGRESLGDRRRPLPGLRRSRTIHPSTRAASPSPPAAVLSQLAGRPELSVDRSSRVVDDPSRGTRGSSQGRNDSSPCRYRSSRGVEGSSPCRYRSSCGTEGPSPCRYRSSCGTEGSSPCRRRSSQGTDGSWRGTDRPFARAADKTAARRDWEQASGERAGIEITGRAAAAAPGLFAF